MSTIGLRFTPPDESYEGFKFRMALIVCLVFGYLTALFFVKHVLVFHPDPDHVVGLLPEPFHVIGNYMLAYYCRTSSGALELLLTLAGFGAVFWLNLPKQYFAGRYRDYGKDRPSAEAKSLTLFLTLMALSLVLLSLPFLTLHFPGWMSWAVKYGPLVAGVLQYLSILPQIKDIERTPAIDKLDWNMRSFDATHRSTPNQAVEKELKACSSIMSQSSQDAVRRFLAQGSVTVTWSGVDALFRNLETFLGVNAESITLHESTAQSIEFALGELLDARGAEPTLVLTTDAEHRSVRDTLQERLQPIYRFKLETISMQKLLWNNASSKEIVSALVKALVENKPDIAVLSHVFPDTGIVLDLKELIDAAQKENLRTLFVIDGSQAVGNILVNDEAFVRSAYYAFHGQGWLLGSPSIGILIRNGWLLRAMAEIRQAALTMRPCSSFHQADSHDISPTFEGSLPSFALNFVLKHEWLAVGIENATKHTSKLASLFRDEMRKRGIRIIGISGQSSAVVITDIPQVEALHHALQSKRLDCRIVTADLDDGERASGIRFCFHHYHSDEDVLDLAELIGNINADINRDTADAPAESRANRRSFGHAA
jgi:selenocysteine lyase/cysteine desulfurase